MGRRNHRRDDTPSVTYVTYITYVTYVTSVTGLGKRCAEIQIYDPRWSSPVDEDRNLHIPQRHGNPSPLAALQWAINKGMGFQDEGEWSITDTPWPLLMKYGIANFQTEECDWMWDNFNYAPFHSPSYDGDYEHIQKVCKPSNWNYASLPRIAEDGRVCGGLAYWATGIHTCLGRPATQVGQPGHGCHIYYDRDVRGNWKHEMSGSVYHNWEYV